MSDIINSLDYIYTLFLIEDKELLKSIMKYWVNLVALLTKALIKNKSKIENI